MSMFNYRRLMNKVMSTIQDDSRKELISMRRNAGLTQSELARRLIPECTQATVSRWEQSRSERTKRNYTKRLNGWVTRLK